MRLHIATALTLAATMLAAPLQTAAATHGEWLAGGGSYEPSTKYDTAAHMFQWASNATDRDGRVLEKIYLNGYFTTAPVPRVAVRTDLNLDGGNVYSPLANVAVAVLGYWRDCNGDGYIGAKTTPMAYGSFSAYPAALDGVAYTINTTLCPPKSPYWLQNPSTSQDNGFIDEFRWIGPDAGCDRYEAACPGSTLQPARACVPPSAPAACVDGLRPMTDGINDVTDNRSRVWGDWERPGYPHVPYGPLTPLPRGTFNDAHGTLRFVDDATLNSLSGLIDAWPVVPNVGGCDDWVNPAPLTGEAGTCGLYPLWQVRRAVNDTTCTSADSAHAREHPGCWEPDPLVTTWDLENDDGGGETPCDDQVDTAVPNLLTGGDVARVALPNVQPGYNPNLLTDGSISGTLEHQQRGLGATTLAPAPDDEAQCGTDGGVADFVFEIDAADSQFRHVAPSFPMNFSRDARFHQLAGFGFYDAPAADLLNVLGGPSGIGQPGGLGGGFGTAADPLTNSGPGWFSNLQWTPRPPRHGWGYTTTTYATFYADVTSGAFIGDGKTTTGNALANPATALPAGRQDAHTYGAEFCGAFTTGATNLDPRTSWECSITEWERARAAQNPTNLASRFAAVLGDAYDLRDVDCIDNTVSERNGLVGEYLAGNHVGIARCGDEHGPAT